MQILFNLMALASFTFTSAVIGSGVYIYANKAGIIEKVKEKVNETIAEEISNAIPRALDQSITRPGPSTHTKLLF
jgi:uncharacterized membrane protein